MTAVAQEELLQQLCRDLRLLWRQAGGPSLRSLSGQVRLGKSQISAILNGDIRQLPDWRVVQGLIEGFHRYAQEHGRTQNVSLRTSVDEFWHPRYTMLEHAFQQVGLSRPDKGLSTEERDAWQTPGGVIPRQLPPVVRHFAGRATELETLTNLVTQSASDGQATMITAIDGMAGIGKTALAVSWAHLVADRFSDGQLYVNLRGFDPTGPPMNPAEAVRGFLEALVRPQCIPASLDAQVGLYRSLLANKQVLIVLDNARDAEQVCPLLPGSPHCFVVVTSRNRLSSLIAREGAHPLTLDLMSTAEGRQLLTRHLGHDRAAAYPHALDDIIDRCARLPLALAIVAARAAAHREFPLDMLASELRGASGDLDALTGWDATISIRAVFTWSYHTLSAATARLFRLLGLHPGPEITPPAAASLAGMPVRQARPMLAELTRANLLTEHAPGRYILHDLLRDYATELARTHDTSADRHTALHRMFDYYLHTAHTAARLLDPNRDPITLTPSRPEITPDDLIDHEQALAWFTTEHTMLLKVIERAEATGFDTYTSPLAWTLTDFLERRGHWLDLVTIQSAALDASRRLADKHGQAHASRFLGRAYAWLGRHDDAYVYLRHALGLFAQPSDHVAQAHTHLNLAWVIGLQSRHYVALHQAQKGLDLFRAAGHRCGHALALNVIGWNHAKLGDHQQAIVSCQQALILLQDVGDCAGQAYAWDSLGYSHRHLNHRKQAITCYQQALDLFRDIGHRYYEAEVLTHLGDIYHSAGDHDRAQVAWQEALDILTQLNHPDAQQVRAKLHDAASAATVDTVRTPRKGAPPERILGRGALPW